MPNSFFQEIPIECELCGKIYQYHLWYIVDIEERPDLYAKIIEGTIHQFCCPKCKTEKIGDAPLLVLQKVKKPHLIFVPSNSTNDEEDQNQANTLISTFQLQADSSWNPIWIENGIPFLPLNTIYIAFSKGVNAAIEHLRTKQESHHQGLENVSNIAEFRELKGKILQFVQFSSWFESKQFLQNNLEILSDQSMLILNSMVERAHELNDTMALQTFRINLELLDLCKKKGIEETYEQLLKQDEEDNLVSIPTILDRLTFEERGKVLELEKNASSSDDFFSKLRKDEELEKKVLDLLQSKMKEFDEDEEIPVELRTQIKNASSLEDQFDVNYEISYILKAIEIRKTISTTEGFSHLSYNIQFDLTVDFSTSLFKLYKASGNVDVLEDAILLLTEIMNSSNDKTSGFITASCHLSSMLAEKFLVSSESSFLHKSIRLLEDLLQSEDFESKESSFLLSHLGKRYYVMYEVFGGQLNFEKSLDYSRQALETSSVEDPFKAQRISNLGNIYSEKFKKQGEIGDLHSAINYYEEAAELSDPGSLFQGILLFNLGLCIFYLYEITGDLTKVSKSKKLIERSLGKVVGGSIDEAKYVLGLGTVLFELFEIQDSISDLDRAIDLLKRKIASIDHIDNLTIDFYSNLAIYLSRRYDKVGSFVDLEEALFFAQKAADLTNGDNAKSAPLGNLGSVLSQLYQQTGNLEFLEQSIEVVERAINLSDEYSRLKNTFQNNLSNSLAERFDRRGNRADFVKALSLSEAVIANTPDDDVSKPGYLMNYSNRLKKKFGITSDIADIESAMSISRRAVKLGSKHSTSLPHLLNNLSSNISDYCYYTKNHFLLDEALSLAKEANFLISDSSPEKASFLNDLGLRHKELFYYSDDQNHLKSAIQFWNEALRLDRELDPDLKIRIGKNLGEELLKQGDWENAISAFEHAEISIKMLLGKHKLQADKRAWLALAQGVASKKAYALAKLGQLEEAIETLESGLCQITFSRILQQSWMKSLEVDEPGLANDLHELSGLLQKETIKLRKAIGVATDDDKTLNEMITEFSKLMAESRSLPIFHNYTKEVSIEKLRVSKNAYPMVYISVTPAGTVFYVIEPTGEIDHWFNSTTSDDLHIKMFGSIDGIELGGYFGAYSKFLDTTQKSESRKQISSAKNEWMDSLKYITRWLWDEITEELVEWLEKHGYPRAIIIPNGILSFLPLHASWHPAPNHSGDMEFAIQRVNLTYSPNGTFAISVSQPSPNDINRLLFIANPDGTLPFSSLESDFVAEKTKKEEITILSGKEATLNEVLAHMPNYGILHFASHGSANHQSPLDSNVVLANSELLTVQEVMQLNLEKTRFVVLSACETSVPGINLIDESISLPTSWLQAGVPGVIGSLWVIRDASTAMLMERFYDYFLSGRFDPADALREAQVWMIKTSNQEKQEHFKTISQRIIKDGLSTNIAANSLDNLLLMEESNENIFIHPFFWAAFGYYGN